MLPYTRKDDKTWNKRTPANKIVSDEEWKVLWITYENKSLPKTTPTLTWLFQTDGNTRLASRVGRLGKASGSCSHLPADKDYRDVTKR